MMLRCLLLRAPLRRRVVKRNAGRSSGGTYSAATAATPRAYRSTTRRLINGSNRRAMRSLVASVRRKRLNAPSKRGGLKRPRRLLMGSTSLPRMSHAAHTRAASSSQAARTCSKPKSRRESSFRCNGSSHGEILGLARRPLAFWIAFAIDRTRSRDCCHCARSASALSLSKTPNDTRISAAVRIGCDRVHYGPIGRKGCSAFATSVSGVEQFKREAEREPEPWTVADIVPTDGHGFPMVAHEVPRHRDGAAPRRAARPVHADHHCTEHRRRTTIRRLAINAPGSASGGTPR